MHEPNVQHILDRLRSTDIVLDVGAWACPFNRAQWVLDAEPFETRGFYRTFGGPASQGGEREWFSADTWVRRDMCAREPWPFTDRQFDFAICSHTLEDLRDPLWVCAELMRVARCGYLEVPSRAYESCRGVEHRRIAGLSHHRWLIEIQGNRLVFLLKYHRIHSHWRLSLPPRYRRQLAPECAVQWLWWNGTFEVQEVTLHGLAAIDAELERFVQATYPYPAWQLSLDAAWRQVKGLAARAKNRATRPWRTGRS